jgi:hypothetical protein
MDDNDPDGLNAAQGILYALILSVPFWCVVFFVIFVMVIRISK